MPRRRRRRRPRWGGCRLRLKLIVFGSNSSSRCSVVASAPVASLMRLAARPVGAARRTSTFARASTARMARTIVVLPTPGPPVTTSTERFAASSTALRCSGASSTPAPRLEGARWRLRTPSSACAGAPGDLGAGASRGAPRRRASRLRRRSRSPSTVLDDGAAREQRAPEGVRRGARARPGRPRRAPSICAAAPSAPPRRSRRGPPPSRRAPPGGRPPACARASRPRRRAQPRCGRPS